MTVDPVNSVDPADSLDSVASVPPVASTGLLAIEPEAIETDLNQTDLNQSDASDASQPALAQGALDPGRSPVDPERPGLAAEPLASGLPTEPSIAADPTTTTDPTNAAGLEVTPPASPTLQPSEPEPIELPPPAALEPTPPEPATPEPETPEPLAPLASAPVAPADLPDLPPEDPPEIRQALERLARLRDERDRLRSDILAGRAMMSQIVEAGLVDLDRRRRTLEATIEQLERRQTKLRQEIEATFAGKSQDIAARVQGFKDYLVGSLQELAAAAEELAVPAPATRPDEIEQRPNERPDRPAGRSPERPGDRLDRPDRPIDRPTTGRYDDRPSRQREPNPDPMDNAAGRSAGRGGGRSDVRDPAQPASVGRSPDRRDRPPESIRPQFAASQFQEEQRKIQQWLERYRSQPDYYGPPWKLRRTFEAVHAERATTWFFELGGRGALRSLGSRLQNILVAAATVSILRALYGDRLHLLILVDSPERLGDWRRGLQDCLGLARADFGIDRGVTIFEAPEPMAQRADRLWRNGDLPFILFDESDGRVSLSLLQFPLWLAFAPEPRSNLREDYYL